MLLTPLLDDRPPPWPFFWVIAVVIPSYKYLLVGLVLLVGSNKCQQKTSTIEMNLMEKLLLSVMFILEARKNHPRNQDALDLEHEFKVKTFIL